MIMRYKKNFFGYLLTILPILFGMLIVFVGQNLIAIGIGSVTTGLSGVVIIIRRELPGMWTTIEGTLAVILGIIWLIFWLALGFLILGSAIATQLGS